MRWHHGERGAPQLENVRLRVPALGVALEDFGTGDCALQYRRQLPIDPLKTDRALVAEPTADDADRRAVAIARTIVAMGHELGLTVVAEGGETAARMECLTMIGCDEAQGMALCEPAAPGELA